jgi:hypothetical protein
VGDNLSREELAWRIGFEWMVLCKKLAQLWEEVLDNYDFWLKHITRN